MKKECLSCRNAFHLFCGMCRCFLEPSDSNLHYDNYCCEHYDSVDEEAYEERLMWKERQEKEKEIFEND